MVEHLDLLFGKDSEKARRAERNLKLILVRVVGRLLKVTLSCKLSLRRYDIIDYFSPTIHFPWILNNCNETQVSFNYKVIY